MSNVTLGRTPRIPYSTILASRSCAQPTHRSEATGIFQLVILILLPFSIGYFLSYYLRTVNAVLSTRLMQGLDLNAAQLGIMTSAYFFMAAAAQLPLGWALDRFGPRRVQSACLLLAASGAALFSIAHDVYTLLIARSLIGLGVASALMAGVKALAIACPRDRLGLFNGILVSIGATGAIAASVPTECLLRFIDWRLLFVLVALVALVTSIVIARAVPRGLDYAIAVPSRPLAPGFRQIFADPGFRRLVPLSATTIGGAWALQGLWSGPWLRDVMRLDQASIAEHLLVMAVALSAGALSFGVILHRLSKAGLTPAHAISFAAALLIIAELGLAFAWRLPLLLWGIVSAFAAATVLIFTASAQQFPKESVGRANSAFNLFHFSAAFVIQSLFGQILSLWPRDALGHYPVEAYRFALLGLIAAQAVALLWFMLPQTVNEPDHDRVPRPASSHRRLIATSLGVVVAAAGGYAVYRFTLSHTFVESLSSTRPGAAVRALSSTTDRTEVLGITACGFIGLAFVMSSSLWLRAFAILGSSLFIFYGAVSGQHALLVINAVLLPINAWHLWRTTTDAPTRRRYSSNSMLLDVGRIEGATARTETPRCDAPWT